MTITNSTIARNEALLGDGLYNFATAEVRNSLLVGNGVDFFGEMTSLGYNIAGVIDEFLGPFFNAPGDQVIITARDFLGPLQDNGGPTHTHALLLGSPAIDAGTNIGAPTTDQRGIVRPQDGNANGMAIADVGAFETFFGQISGIRFHDLDQNRLRDANEPGLNGLDIFLDTNRNGSFDLGEPFTTTLSDDPSTFQVNEAGTYSFVGLEPGSYDVSDVLQPGWIRTVLGLTGPRHVGSRRGHSSGEAG